jgi:hypothetical protein
MVSTYKYFARTINQGGISFAIQEMMHTITVIEAIKESYLNSGKQIELD